MASSARDAWNANHTVIALISVRSVRRFDPSFRGGDMYLLPHLFHDFNRGGGNFGKAMQQVGKLTIQYIPFELG